MRIPLVAFLTATAVAVREVGFVSKTVARRENMTPTSEYVLRRLDALLTDATPADADLAGAAYRWMADFRDGGDFFRRAKDVYALGEVSDAQAAIAVCMVPMYQRYLEKRAVLSESSGRHIGTVGERITVNVLVQTKRPIRGGTTTAIELVDAEGNAYVYFTCFPERWSVCVSTPFLLSGRVKRHGVFAKTPTTELTDIQPRSAP